MNEIIFEMARIGMRHASIASSLGLTLHTLRKFYVRELLNGATESEIDARLHHRKPKSTPNRSTPKPPKEPDFPKPKFDRVVFHVYNNEGEPNIQC